MIGLIVNTTITVSIGAILVYLVTVWINTRLTKARTDEDRRAKEFNVVAEAFRNAFTPMQQYLHRSHLWGLFYKQFPSQDAARINFIHYLKGKERRRLDNAWNKYEQKCKEAISVIGKDEMINPNSLAISQFKQEISECIDELLKIAKPK